MAITNAEKFKTAEERTLEFNKACKGKCSTCKIFEAKKHRHETNCPFVWLEMKADVEMPLPCPFCGSRAHERCHIRDDGRPHKYSIECGNPNCRISPDTYYYETRDEAIAAWNKRA